MRRPITLNKPERQQGYALFIVLMMMVVIALLVVTATQSYNTEQRISTNDADHKFATTLAEAALREGENRIYEIEDGDFPFTDNCISTSKTNKNNKKKGLCKAAHVNAGSYLTAEGTITVSGTSTDEAWVRECGTDKCIEKNGKKYEISGIEEDDKEYDEISGIKIKKPRHIIEYLGTNSADKRTIYRVTAKAWGKNKNTQVVLQSYVASE
ncbi:pilus assembly protein [uncultured Neisseria sp.]|uniref:pilus assembly PilX family protein n=1 Tax=uncultured Neisseria sp. TaxID=237778 RepID=UPI0025DCBC8D|nr:pilus assembly protein [uncultured Neisseria sp.]